MYANENKIKIIINMEDNKKMHCVSRSMWANSGGGSLWPDVETVDF